MSKPLIVVQGEKDTFGKRDEVEGYSLSDNIDVVFLPDGDHSFKPPKRAEATLEGNINDAVDAMVRFMESHK